MWDPLDNKSKMYICFIYSHQWSLVTGDLTSEEGVNAILINVINNRTMIYLPETLGGFL
jgi:hypothetical protein